MATSDSGTLTYDFLVVAPGRRAAVDEDSRDLPSLSASRGPACVSNYSYETVASTWEAIRSFRGGTALFTEPVTPVKCGGAPQKIMYLAEEDVPDERRPRGEPRRLHEREADVVHGAVLHIPALERRHRGAAAWRSSSARSFVRGHAVPDAHEAVFRDVKTGTEQVMRYDIIHVRHAPMSPPEFVRTGPLANADGWIEVDKFSLQHVRYPEVFSLGDASNLPTSKTGAAIRKQAPVVVENLLALRAGQPLAGAV